MTKNVEQVLPLRAVPRDQTGPQRVKVMRELVKKAFTAKVRALEIGVWYGIGSTNIWMESLPEQSELVLFDSWRPYASKADVYEEGLYPSNWDYAKMDSLTTEAFLSTFLRVRKFEDERNSKNVSLIRSSSSFLSFIKDGTFDFIYIDADHKYDSVKRDIIEAKRLANKTFSIICGDDLEKLPTAKLLEVAAQFKDRDFIRGEFNFHPGVCLAVHEEFGQINMHEGFWWIVCVEGVFKNDILSAGELLSSQPVP